MWIDTIAKSNEHSFYVYLGKLWSVYAFEPFDKALFFSFLFSW